VIFNDFRPHCCSRRHLECAQSCAFDEDEETEAWPVHASLPPTL
jgi:hypothetical protein